MQEVLLEIQSFFFRRDSTITQPGIGRTALAAFSSGNPLVTTFLERNRSHPFCENVLNEVYMFDTPNGDKDAWATQVSSWLRSGDSTTKRACAYVQTPHPKLLQLVGGWPAGARMPFITASADGRRTLGVIPGNVWRTALNEHGGRIIELFQDAHQLISATLLTDALRRSGF
jgi:hypothetical protein